MTDKTYTAEQVERAAFEDMATSYGWPLEMSGTSYASDETDLLWGGFRWGTAYAATLRQPSSEPRYSHSADGKHVTLLNPEDARYWEHPASSEPASGEVEIAAFVEKAGEIIAGKPFPSGFALAKARQIADLSLALHPAETVNAPPGLVLVPREALGYVSDLLAERKQGLAGRSPAHNARVVVDYWLNVDATPGADGEVSCGD